MCLHDTEEKTLNILIMIFEFYIHLKKLLARKVGIRDKDEGKNERSDLKVYMDICWVAFVMYT